MTAINPTYGNVTLDEYLGMDSTIRVLNSSGIISSNGSKIIQAKVIKARDTLEIRARIPETLTLDLSHLEGTDICVNSVTWVPEGLDFTISYKENGTTTEQPIRIRYSGDSLLE